ncbi:MAG TPA: RAMP superfamily CRISPR-associated protein, partial [Ktedonobacteraceae bacterium]|nr:RAMP superfamily CRISPR-associated protein [Ktedonobacteraceae bacterium]
MVETRIDRIQIDYTLTFKTPFHCGTGIRAGLIDRTVVKDGAGYLYVPGSTFKGMVREYCEQLSRMFEELDDDMRERIADPHE